MIIMMIITLILSRDSRDLIFEGRRRPARRRRRPARRHRRTVVPTVALFVNTIVCRRLQVAAGCIQEVAA